MYIYIYILTLEFINLTNLKQNKKIIKCSFFYIIRNIAENKV